MFFPFETMPDHSRVWIYQSNRVLTSAETELLSSGLKELCEQWSAHGTPLHTSFTISQQQFVIMMVDEQQHGASGCSIDGSVRYLKSLQGSLSLNFFDRSHIAFLKNGKIVLHDLKN